MTQHRDVNKCRRKEKFKMAALIRQTNSGYELANKPKIKMKDAWWKRRERKQNNDSNNKHFLKRKRRPEMSASNVTKAGYT